MEVIQALLLLLVAALGTVVVVTREPLSQGIVLSLFGTMFAVLFVIYQAPDVALSQIVVGSIVLPLIIVVTVARTRRRPK
jgi:energy-converting hydrogenase B subunit D